MTDHTLTGDDVALAAAACSLAIAWHKAGPHRRTRFVRQEIAKLSALSARLHGICEHAYPYQHSDDMPLDAGRSRS